MMKNITKKPNNKRKLNKIFLYNAFGFYNKKSIKFNINKELISEKFYKKKKVYNMNFFINKKKIKYGYKTKPINLKNLFILNRRIGYNLKKKFFSHFIFIKKVFNTFIKNGLKIKVIHMFSKVLNILNFKFNKLKKKIIMNVFFIQITKNIIPVLHTVSKHKKGERVLLPWMLLNNKRLITLSCRWIKKSISFRKEKTLFLKLISEFNSIRKNKNSVSLEFKKNYYKNFYENKYFIRYLKRRSWI